MISLIILIFLNSHLVEKVYLGNRSFLNDTITIYGKCYDNSTRDVLPIKGKVLVKESAPIYFNSNKLGMLDFKIPATATTIIFESPGYKQEVIPIHHIAPYTDDSKFIIHIPMSRIDSISVIQNDVLSLCFIIKEPIDVYYKFSLKNEPHKFTAFTYLPNHMPKHMDIPMNYIGNYVLTATLGNKELLFTKEFTLEKGINFKSIVVERNKLDSGKEEEMPNINNKNKFLIMFSQSDYALSDSSKVSLNIVANLLLKDSELVLKIIGHTDNVGKEKLNMTLSEYRARVTAQYLIKKGIPANRIEYEGKGSSSPLFPNDTEANKKGNRRVELTITKR